MNKIKNYTLLIISTAIVLSLCGKTTCFAEDEAVLLFYKFKEGEILKWNVLQSQKIITSIQGKTVKVETSSRSVKLWKTIKVNKEEAVFEYSVDNVVMSQSQTDKDPAHYDSKKDKEIPMYFSNLEGMIGVPLANLTITASGETKKKVALRNYAAANQEHRITIPLPKNPVKVGETWFEAMPLEISQGDGTIKKVNARQKFTLDSYKTGVAKISFVTQILTPLSPREESQILDKYTSGNLVLDLDAGHLISQKSKVNKQVVGFQGASDNVHHETEFRECCCGMKSCDICSPTQ